MKKIFAAAIMLTLFIGCSEGVKKSDEPAASDRSLSLAPGKNDSITSNDANEMISEFKKVKIDKDSLAFTEFKVADLQQLFCDTSSSQAITRVRFFLGGIESDDGKKRKIPIVIMQLQRGGSTLSPEYSYSYYKGDPDVCPPPEPCLSEQR